jgi:predicted N-acyltransferase
MGDSEKIVVNVVPSLAGIDPSKWDACANPDPARHNPFVSYAFLKALEDAKTVGEGTGWLPHHLVLGDGSDEITGCAPCYLKTHSQGEYVFDHGWADAYERAGGQYYPKLQISVPFTPVPGPRLLARPGPQAPTVERLLAAAAVELARQNDISSVHITFLDEAPARRLSSAGFLHRLGQQFHWQNHGYASFDDFLGTLASRKRKAIRRERAEAVAAGIEIEWVTGPDLRERHWDAFYRFYMDTADRKWGRPYLNRAFFSELGQHMADRCLLILAKRAGTYIAGALNLIGGDCLFGRHWGATEHHPFLHFELCYYQAIDYAIAHGLARVEAGAQGEHKLARGYLPVETHSVHWIADPSFRNAVARFLEQERNAVTVDAEFLREHGPYRKQIIDHGE